MMRRARTAVAVLALLACAACQHDAPSPIGEAWVYATGTITVGDSVQKPLTIRLDRQACLQSTGVALRDASGLGVLVVQRPTAGFAVRTYTLPRQAATARGYLNVAGIASSFPLVRGTTVITRADSIAVDGRLDWTLGHPTAVQGVGDSTRSRVRVVGTFHAVRVPCD